jgi:hypothetical protein
MRAIPIILAISILVLGCDHTPNTIQIQEKVSDYNDVDSL